MSDNTPQLTLPMIQPAQAQKHITHNEALVRLDGLVQMRIAGFDIDTPPSNPDDGQIFAIGTAPTDEWAGHSGKLAQRIGNGWEFLDPLEGWQGWDETAGQMRVYVNNTWQGLQTSTQNLGPVGIGASANTTNRLTVASDASLFNHAGNGHQMKLNKAQAGDTASLLFQSNWTGHAEMGLSGDTNFAVKISPDGSTWVTAFRADATTQELVVDLPLTGQSVQQSADDVTAGRLMRADWGYGPGNLVGSVAMSGTTPSGAVIEHGQTTTGTYVRWADGTQICWAQASLSYDSASRLVYAWVFPAAFFGAAPVVTAGIADETTASIGAGDFAGPYGTQATLTGANVRLYSRNGSAGFQSTDSISATMTAMGRWT